LHKTVGDDAGKDGKMVGPGSYDRNMVDKTSNPKYSIAGKYSSKQESIGGGPGSYELPSKVRVFV